MKKLSGVSRRLVKKISDETGRWRESSLEPGVGSWSFCKELNHPDESGPKDPFGKSEIFIFVAFWNQRSKDGFPKSG